MSQNLFGVVATIGIWACMAGLRSFRDFYTQQIFSAALNGTPTAEAQRADSDNNPLILVLIYTYIYLCIYY